MDVTLLYFPDCPNWKIAGERLQVIIAERGDITLTHRLVESPQEAERVGFHGSPSILIDGVDVFAEPGARVGLTCRRYPTPQGYAGAPTLAQLREVLTNA